MTQIESHHKRPMCKWLGGEILGQFRVINCWVQF